jgi:hypothetical protein
MCEGVAPKQMKQALSLGMVNSLTHMPVRCLRPALEVSVGKLPLLTVLPVTALCSVYAH